MPDTNLQLTSLSVELLEPALEICETCIGKNLYTKEILLKAITDPMQKFLLLVTSENKPVAYFYFRLIEIEEAEKLAKISLLKLKNLTGKEKPLFGNMQSIGIIPEYRNRRLSNFLVEQCLQWLIEKTEADIVIGVCWKPSGKVPMEKTLKRYEFSHLADVRRLWYDRVDLICPVCSGRCECDGAIYYKRLERNVAQ